MTVRSSGFSAEIALLRGVVAKLLNGLFVV